MAQVLSLINQSDDVLQRMNAVMVLNGQGQGLGQGQGQGYYSAINGHGPDGNTDQRMMAMTSGRPSPIVSPSTTSPPLASYTKTTTPPMSSSPSKSTNIASSLSFASPDDRASKSPMTGLTGQRSTPTPTRHTPSSAAASSTNVSPGSPIITSTLFALSDNNNNNNNSPSAHATITDSLSSWRELCHSLEKERDELRVAQVGDPPWSSPIYEPLWSSPIHVPRLTSLSWSCCK